VPDDNGGPRPPDIDQQVLDRLSDGGSERYRARPDMPWV
jgi:hypothetical protein